MTNNDILRRLRYTLDFNDSKMMALFASGGREVTRKQVSDWLKRDDDPDYTNCSDTCLAMFLNGLINDRRGTREGAQPQVEKRLTNNNILVKLRIALNLKAEDILEILALADQHISKHELSAFFRKPGNKHFRQGEDSCKRGCGNQKGTEGKDCFRPPPTETQMAGDIVHQSRPGGGRDSADLWQKVGY